MKLLIPSFLIVIMVTYFCYRITKSSDHAESVISAQQASMVVGLVGTTTDEDPTHVIVDGDEMPGIGAGVARPDTALVYFNETDRRIHIKYLAPAVIH